MEVTNNKRMNGQPAQQPESGSKFEVDLAASYRVQNIIQRQSKNGGHTYYEVFLSGPNGTFTVPAYEAVGSQIASNNAYRFEYSYRKVTRDKITKDGRKFKVTDCYLGITGFRN